MTSPKRQTKKKKQKIQRKIKKKNRKHKNTTENSKEVFFKPQKTGRVRKGRLRARIDGWGETGWLWDAVPGGSPREAGKAWIKACGGRQRLSCVLKGFRLVRGFAGVRWAGRGLC